MPTLSQLEHVLEAVDDLEAAIGRQLTNISRVEEPILICTNNTDDAHSHVHDVHSSPC